MSETRGIFGLTEAVDQKLDDEWVPLNQVFNGNTRFSDGSAIQALHNIGYVVGGNYSPSYPNARETCDRIQFANDTSSQVPGSLNETTDNTVSTSSLTAAYRSGGGPGSLSNTEKITYSTETYNLLPSSANLSFPKIEHMGGGNSTQGYFVGGYTHGGSYPMRSSTDKITYSNDTAARLPGANQPSSTFPSRKGSALSATTHGYFGGSGQPNNSRVDKMVYSVETLNLTPTAFLSTTSPSGRRQRAGSSSFGYFQYVSIVEKLVYSTDTLERIPSANLSVTSRYENGGTGGPTAGYFAGGAPSRTDMEKVNFATDTPSAIPSHLANGRDYAGAVSAFDNGTENIVKPTATPSPNFQAGPNAGYISGGAPSTAPRLSSTDKLDFASDTTTTIPSANSPSFPSGVSYRGQAHSSTKSYFAGGNSPGGRKSIIEKLTYSTEATERIPGANLTNTCDKVSGISSPSAGYFGGIQPESPSPGYTTKVDKLTFSNDTVSYTPSANLSLSRREVASAGNTTHGYFGGGARPSGFRYTTVDKLTYSNDTTAVSPSSALSGARYNLGAIGNDTQGYFGGGQPGSAPAGAQNTDKITYSTDTSSLAPTASAGPNERSNYASTGNIANGYWISGYANPAPALSDVFKLVYASETSFLTPTANLASARYGMTGSSSRMDGASSSNIV